MLLLAIKKYVLYKLFKLQHRCVAIFKDKHQQNGEGFALGGIEGKVAIINLNSKNPLGVVMYIYF